MSLAIVFDNETTGLLFHPEAELAKQPRCIEFGAALLSRETGEVIDRMNVLINSGMKLPEEIIKITGIVDDDLKDAPSFVDALPQIADFFRRAETMFAHNLRFDEEILKNELRRLGEKFVLSFEFAWPARAFCTVGLYRDEFGYNPKMSELYERVMGRPMSHSHQAHRALDDVLALVEIIQKERLYSL